MNLRIAFTALVSAASLTAIVSCGGGVGDDSVPIYSVSGTLAGSVGTVVLQLNGAGDISLTAPGTFTFTGGVPVGANYTVTANGAQKCNVANGTGAMGSTNITNVTITCTTVIRSAALSGAQENPPNPSTATGRGAIIVNPTTREITGGVMFSGFTPSAGGHHIHQAPAGNPNGNGGVIIALVLAPGGGVATVPAGATLTESQYAALLAGELYFNVHSAVYPGGEIRGPITGRVGLSAGLASLSGASENPPTLSTASGRGSIVFDSTTRDVFIAYVTHNVGGTTVAHIHTGAPGANGPANVATLTQGTGVYSAPNPTQLTAQNASDFNAGNTYFNVHSATFPSGEVRGQIAVQ